MTHKTLLITGGSRGIGLATAKKFCAEAVDPLNVVLVARSASELGAAADELRSTAQSTLSVQTVTADLGQRDEVLGLARSVHSQYGQVHYLVNNAGYMYLLLSIRSQ